MDHNCAISRNIPQFHQHVAMCCVARSTCSSLRSDQASAEHFQQCAEFLLLRDRGLGPLAVTVLPIPLAGGLPAPLAPPCNRHRPFFVAGDRQGFSFWSGGPPALPEIWRQATA